MYICPLWISGFDWLNLFREKQRTNTYNDIEKYKDSTEKGSSYFHHVHLWGVSNLCYRIEKQVKNLDYKNKNFVSVIDSILPITHYCLCFDASK